MIDQPSNTTAGMRTIVAVCVLVGACFRLYHLGNKTCWFDETWTSAHITGHRIGDFIRTVADGDRFTAGSLQQYVKPDADMSLTKTVRLLAQSDAKTKRAWEKFRTAQTKKVLKAKLP